MRATIFLLLTAWICTPVFAETSPPSDTVNAVWNALSIFEGTTVTVTNDFDCQGISIGLAQWNVGKSFNSVKSIILSNPREQIELLMPSYGAKLIEALNKGREAMLSFVRTLQTIEQPASCDSATRKARWSPDGKLFVTELKKLLTTENSVNSQYALRKDIFLEGWRNANKWAKANRGQDAIPSLKEIAYFVDMQNFNGGGLEKFSLPYKALEGQECLNLSRTMLKYLADPPKDETFLLHRIAAKKNSQILKPEDLSENDRSLFCSSYQVALQLNAKHSRQFRLTTINRRAAILFGQAYYSDHDERPTKIVLTLL